VITDHINKYFDLELTVKVDTEVTDCTGAFDGRAAYGKSVIIFVWYFRES